eukprot:1177665-Prorocentrum_minimum.AAC.3
MLAGPKVGEQWERVGSWTRRREKGKGNSGRYARTLAVIGTRGPAKRSNSIGGARTINPPTASAPASCMVGSRTARPIRSSPASSPPAAAIPPIIAAADTPPTPLCRQTDPPAPKPRQATLYSEGAPKSRGV